MFSIGDVLSKAWKIIWKHKILWLFGILASCGSGGGGGSNVTSRFNFGGSNVGNPESFLPPEVQRFINNLNQVPEGTWIAIAIGLLVLVLILWVLAIVLSTIGRAGLIRGTQMVEEGAESLPFSQLFGESMRFFWRVLGLNLVVGIIMFVVVLVLVGIIILLSIATLGIGIICIIPLICLLIPVGIAVGVWLEFANTALVVDDLSIVEAMRRGWNVIKNNAGNVIIMWLILFIIGLVAGLIIGLPFILIVAPVLLGVIGGTQTTLNTSLIIAGLCFVIYIPILLILNGILQSYLQSAWTLTYMRLSKLPPRAAQPYGYPPQPYGYPPQPPVNPPQAPQPPAYPQTPPENQQPPSPTGGVDVF